MSYLGLLVGSPTWLPPLPKSLLQGIQPASPEANMDDDLGWYILLNPVVMEQKGTVAGCLGGREVAERMFCRGKTYVFPRNVRTLVTAQVLGT
jgi:hypothetical protein